MAFKPLHLRHLSSAPLNLRKRVPPKSGSENTSRNSLISPPPNRTRPVRPADIPPNSQPRTISQSNYITQLRTRSSLRTTSQPKTASHLRAVNSPTATKPLKNSTYLRLLSTRGVMPNVRTRQTPCPPYMKPNSLPMPLRSLPLSPITNTTSSRPSLPEALKTMTSQHLLWQASAISSPQPCKPTFPPLLLKFSNTS